jgi:hypothetical protein
MRRGATLDLDARSPKVSRLFRDMRVPKSSRLFRGFGFSPDERLLCPLGDHFSKVFLSLLSAVFKLTVGDFSKHSTCC